MGYAATQILLFGIKIIEEKAKQIYDRFFSEELANGEEWDPYKKEYDFGLDPIYRRLSSYDRQRGGRQQFPVSQLREHNDGGRDSAVRNPCLVQSLAIIMSMYR